jgi:hypothetical protein
MAADRRIVCRLLLASLRLHYRLWQRMNRQAVPRYWSNDELRRLAPLFTGHVLNVSAGQDSDKEMGVYRDYFSNAASYATTNYKPERSDGCTGELFLDLSTPLSINSPLISAYDVVFTHTVLEHVYDMNTAFDTLCRLSRDVIITIVPFMQPLHRKDGLYGDYWRYSPDALSAMFEARGYHLLYTNWNEDPLGNIYVLHVVSSNPGKWSTLRDMHRRHASNYGPGYFHQTMISGGQQPLADGMCASQVRSWE